MTYTRCGIDTIDSPDDEHRGARNMQRTGINIYKKEIVRQVGYLQELNRDARSAKHKSFIRRSTTSHIRTDMLLLAILMMKLCRSKRLCQIS